MKFMMLAVLMLLAASVFGQDPSESQLNERIASARLIAAEQMPSVTSKQCVADVASWEARNDTDVATKVQEPSYWYEKLSTEELVRLSSETISCHKISTPYSIVSTKMSVWDGVFRLQLYFRAETILRNHGLIHELLLETSH
jgi:uncharacterized protein YcfL